MLSGTKTPPTLKHAKNRTISSSEVERQKPIRSPLTTPSDASPAAARSDASSSSRNDIQSSPHFTNGSSGVADARDRRIWLIVALVTAKPRSRGGSTSSHPTFG